MSVIDKTMYEYLKNWCDFNRPENQHMMYVNSHDRALTNATIRKLMFEIKEEDIHGEVYIAFYSAENFYGNMREYYTHIARLYLQEPAEDEPIVDIIENIPPTCGWIILIVEDIETLSDDPGRMKEMFKSFLSFALDLSSIILIGDGDYKESFAGCELALNEMTDGINAKEEDDILMIGCYDQDVTPERQNVIYDSVEKHRNELDYYWDTMYAQLEKGFFDYEDYKFLFKETLEYIIPRVSKEKVNRKDLRLIENIGAMQRENHKDIEGCSIWVSI